MSHLMSIRRGWWLIVVACLPVLAAAVLIPTMISRSQETDGPLLATIDEGILASGGVLLERAPAGISPNIDEAAATSRAKMTTAGADFREVVLLKVTQANNVPPTTCTCWVFVVDAIPTFSVPIGHEPLKLASTIWLELIDSETGEDYTIAVGIPAR
jgi:hypothetical protein